MNTIAFPEQSLVAVIEMVYSRCLTLCPRNSYGKLKVFLLGLQGFYKCLLLLRRLWFK